MRMRPWRSLRAGARIAAAPGPSATRTASGHREASSAASALRDWAPGREDVRFRFRCTQCGKCCTGRGGRVRVNERERQQIASATRESVERATAKYLRPGERGGWLLRQSPDDARCVFLDGAKCTIYDARPTQCRTYPWWPHHLVSDYDWRVAALECEGISTDSTVDGERGADTEAEAPPALSFDDVAPQVIAHDIHRSGENFTHGEVMEMLGELLDADPSFVDEFKAEFFAKFSRALVFQDEELAVLDTSLGGAAAPRTRCLVFKDRLQLVQSEVRLDEQSGAIDRSRLTLEVHRALCVPFVWLPRAEAAHVRVAVLGAGAATLPLFLLQHLPQVAHVDAVEPNARVLAVANEFFGVREFLDRCPDRLTLHEQLGEDFLQRRTEARASEPFDLLVVDVDSGETRDGVAAPPPRLLSPAFLDGVKQQLAPGTGVAAFNVIALTPEALARVRDTLRAAFPHGMAVQLAQTRNTVFFLFNGGGARDRLTPELLARDRFQRETAQTAQLMAEAAETLCHW